MAYARGKYGVEYTPQPASGGKNHHLRWLLVCLIVLVAVPIFVARSRRSERPPVMTLEQPKVMVPDTPPPAAVGVEPRQASPKPEPTSRGKAEAEKPQVAPPPPPKPPRKVLRDSPFVAKIGRASCRERV